MTSIAASAISVPNASARHPPWLAGRDMSPDKSGLFRLAGG